MKTISVLITCHNRKHKTVGCLESLFIQTGLDVNFKVSVFLVDDGSTDGTSAMISENFPQIRLIQGDGNLFWNRGMHLAWEIASGETNADYYLWLNDDTYLIDSAILSLIDYSQSNAITCGATLHSEISDVLTYGGFSKKTGKLLVPNGIVQECDYFNGNIVLIPRSVFEKIGNLDPLFNHALGDFDYGLRAKAKGVSIVLAPKIIGFCEEHSKAPVWRSSEYRISDRLRNLYSPLSGCHPKELFLF